MGANTKIQWCDYSWNPWEGCTKVSPGCLNCYADTRAQRFGQVKWGKGQPRRRTSASNWHLPVKWNKRQVVCLTCGEWHPSVNWTDVSVSPHIGCCLKCSSRQPMEFRRPRVFCASLADWLDEEVPAEWLGDLLTLIHKTPNLDWLLLTKRPENFRTRLLAARSTIRPDPLDMTDRIDAWLEDTRIPLNVWLGVSVEDQTRADERIPILLSIPAKVRFLSCEPLLGPVDLKPFAPFSVAHGLTLTDSGKYFGGIQWAIIGGESGPNARPCNVEWIRSLVSQCRDAGVAPFVKQLGTSVVVGGDDDFSDGGQYMGENRYRKELADKKGGDMAEWPEDLRVREFPR